MAQQVRAPAEKPDDPSLIPGSGVRTNSSRLSADLWRVHSGVYTRHTHILVKRMLGGWEMRTVYYSGISPITNDCEKTKKRNVRYRNSEIHPDLP